MSLDSLKPIAGNHAIQAVAFVLEWATPLDAQNLRSIRSIGETLRGSFPIVQEQQIATVQIDLRKANRPAAKAGTKARIPAPPNPPQHPELGGIQFTAPAPHSPGQVSRSIQVTRTNCVVVVNEYSRWDSVWPLVLGWISSLLPAALPNRPITAFTLQYHDAFNWEANPDELNLREVFAADCPYLPANCYDLKNLWHSHHGFIEDIKEPCAAKVLDNINVQVHDIAVGQRQISAVLTHKLTFDAPVWSSALKSTLEVVAPWLHLRNKDRLNVLLSDAVKTRIGLATNGERTS